MQSDNLILNVTEILNKHQHLIEFTDSINLKTFEDREQLLKILASLLAIFNESTALLNTALENTKSTHARELAVMDAIVNRDKKKLEPPSQPTKVRVPQLIAETSQNNTPWMTISRGKKVELSRVETPARGRIKFTEALSLSAIRVPTFAYVKQDGELYYVECADHFALRIAGQLLHGNIGAIYTEEKNPEKIKNCKFASGCMKQHNCDYYHDPIDFPGSKDHRNFIASSWLYSPPGQFSNRPRSRRFGSRNNLDTDIMGLQPEEIARFHDQTMHDLLCSMLLSETYKKI